MYLYQHKIKLHETDAAGLLFFSQQFNIIHDAYEALLEKIGFGFAELIKNKTFFLPIVHAESDYKKGLFVDDVIEVEVKLSHIGTSSFTFEYVIKNVKSEIVGSAKTVHVTMDKNTSTKIAIPSDMLEKIKELHQQDV